MRWTQESSDAATPCGKHRYQVLDNFRVWCADSLPEAFRGRNFFCPFGTISEQFLRGLHSGECNMAEHCPSFQELISIRTTLGRCLVSTLRRPSSGNTWESMFSHEEARDLGMSSSWTSEYRKSPSVLFRESQVALAIDGAVPASAASAR